MAFTLPQFVNDCNIWHDGTLITDPPDLFSVCQLYLNTRGLLDITEGNDVQWMPPIWLRVPFGLDVRRLDTVECPAGSGRLYHVRFVEFVHLNFPNQYTVALCNQIVSVPPPPPGADEILLESGDKILLETTGVILLE
jgi:hypothetical protein